MNVRLLCGLLLAGLTALSLGGCQSSPAGDALTSEPVQQTVAEQSPAAPAGDPGKQIFGSGPVSVALFVDTIGAPAVAADQRDGAVLAVQQLAAGQITLSVIDLRGNWENLDGRVQEALSAGATLLIGPADIGSTPAWKKAAKAPPVLALSPSSSPVKKGVYPIASDEIDSAVEAAAYSAANHHGSVLVVSRNPLSAVDVERLRHSMEARGARLIGPLVMPPAASEDDRRMIAEANAVMVFGTAPAPALAAARDSGLARGAWILGTSEWKAGNMPEGAFVAAIDRGGLTLVANAFQRTFGRALSAEAAFAYDAVAVAAGILRSKGVSGLSASGLQASAGFVGATGAFRFPEGRIERRLSIYRVTSGVLKEHEPAQRQF